MLWSEHWRTLQPQTDTEGGNLMDALLRTLDLQAATSARTDGNTVAQRKELADRLARLFRAGAGTVIATACHLGLVALDVERLRGGLVTRYIFVSQSGEAA
jgi:hypothetical protein